MRTCVCAGIGSDGFSLWLWDGQGWLWRGRGGRVGAEVDVEWEMSTAGVDR
jgi:hypothetical protein